MRKEIPLIVGQIKIGEEFGLGVVVKVGDKSIIVDFPNDEKVVQRPIGEKGVEGWPEWYIPQDY